MSSLSAFFSVTPIVAVAAFWLYHTTLTSVHRDNDDNDDMNQWFSESGKLVQRLFEHILELADDEDSLVCVLVDEVSNSIEWPSGARHKVQYGIRYGTVGRVTRLRAINDGAV